MFLTVMANDMLQLHPSHRKLSMPTIRHQVGIAATFEDVYKAIASCEGVSQWWTKTAGDFKLGGTIEFDFEIMKMPMQVTTLNNTTVQWQVLAGDEQWKDTHITFELEQRDGQVMVNFKHADWRETTDLFDHCSTKWAVFMLSLKAYVETGTGKPVPNDIAINHY